MRAGSNQGPQLAWKVETASKRKDWVAVKELELSYSSKDTPLFIIHPCYGNLTLYPYYGNLRYAQYAHIMVTQTPGRM